MSNFANELGPATHTYSRGPNLLEIAAMGFDIEVSSEQVQHWQLMFRAMHELDSILDGREQFDVRSRKYDGVLGIITGDTHEGCSGCYACNLQSFTAVAPDGVKDRFLLNAERIKYLGEERRLATNARNLGQVAMEEGRLSAELLELQDSVQSVRRFNMWLGNAGIVGALLDTAIDLPSDYEVGLTQVRPTLLNRFTLAAMSTPYVTKVVRHLDLSMAQPFAKAIFTVRQDQEKDLIQQAA